MMHNRLPVHPGKNSPIFQRLAAAFDALIEERIVCIHNASYTKSDGEWECEETVSKLQNKGIQPVGYCYYHGQDLARAINPEIRNLFLGFDSVTHNDMQAVAVAERIRQTLERHGFTVNWPGTVDQRIEISDLTWQKVPDLEDWGMQRVIRLMSVVAAVKKQWWKIW